MRKPFIAGNWKMNLDVDASVALAKSLTEKIGDVTDRTVMIAPNFTALAPVADVVRNSSIQLGAQNMHHEPSGAFTGEVSAEMLKSVGVRFVILGHSERRSLFQESSEFVNTKVKAALKADLLPVVCIGETLEERESDRMESVIKDQVSKSLAGLSDTDMSKITLAYEPVWAIGTGKTATPENADSVHQYIRGLLTEQFSTAVAENTVIQYGGSVKDSNVDNLMAKPNIDGGLVGGASLKPDSFARIVKFE